MSIRKDGFMPFSNPSKLEEAINEHGAYVQKIKFSPIIETYKIENFGSDEDGVLLMVTIEKEGAMSALDFLEDYEFLDGHPCGEEDKYNELFMEIMDRLKTSIKNEKKGGN